MDFAKEMDKSLKRLISGITEDEREENRETSDHYDAVQAVKMKAVKNKVNPMRHLTGIDERKDEITSSKKKPEIKTKAGKVKRGSPTKPLTTGSPKKRNVPQKTGKKKNATRKTPNSSTNIQLLEQHNTEIGANFNLEDFGKVTIRENDTEEEIKIEVTDPDTQSQDINIKIDTLPVLIKTAGEGRYVQIEFIDEYVDPNDGDRVTEKERDGESNEPNTAFVNEGHEVNETDEPSTSSDARNKVVDNPKVSQRNSRHVFKEPLPVKRLKRPERRDLKKTILKSKFKKMGILPVANFKDNK